MDLANIHCLILERITIHKTTNKIAIIPFTIDVSSEFIAPNPDIEIGPKTETTIPPPIKIKIHIQKMNP